MYCRGHALVDRACGTCEAPCCYLHNKSYNHILKLSVRERNVNRFLLLMSFNCLFRIVLVRELRLAQGHRLADVRSSGCVSLQGGGWSEERQR